jgi:predicted ATPase
MRLQRLAAQNFRLLKEFSIDFVPDVTVLIGANNVGKSNVIDAILLFKEAMQSAIDQVLASRFQFVRVVSQHQIQDRINLTLSFSDGLAYGLTLASEGIVAERLVTPLESLRASLETLGLPFALPGGRLRVQGGQDKSA